MADAAGRGKHKMMLYPSLHWHSMACWCPTSSLADQDRRLDAFLAKEVETQPKTRRLSPRGEHRTWSEHGKERCRC